MKISVITKPSLLFVACVFILNQVSTSHVWVCPNLVMSVERAKLVNEFFSFGHYEGSCLRQAESSDVAVMCHNQTYCGVGLKPRPALMTDSNSQWIPGLSSHGSPLMRIDFPWIPIDENRFSMDPHR